MSNKVEFIEPSLTKFGVLKALSVGLQQLAFEADGDEFIFASDTKQTKDGVIIECTNGSTIVLEVKSIKN